MLCMFYQVKQKETMNNILGFVKTVYWEYDRKIFVYLL